MLVELLNIDQKSTSKNIWGKKSIVFLFKKCSFLYIITHCGGAVSALWSQPKSLVEALDGKQPKVCLIDTAVESWEKKCSWSKGKENKKF